MTDAVRITDHALLRWLQRVHGFDMDAYRDQLAIVATPFAAAKVKHAEVGGVCLVFEGTTLVTVTPDKPDLHALRRNDREARNGTHLPPDRLNWKAQARKRNHK